MIEAGDEGQLKQALGQLAGNVGRPMQELREDLLNLLADVEAALDFADEDIAFVQPDETLRRLGKGLAHLTLVNRQLEQRSLSDRPFRVVLAGRPNVGKSSLFNALTGGSALVSAEPGTTRDYLIGQLDLDDVAVELIDTAGLRPSTDFIEGLSQTLGRGQAEQCDLLLLCLEGGRVEHALEADLLERTQPPVLALATKSDLGLSAAEVPAVSAVTGEGLAELRALLGERAGTRGRRPWPRA